MTMTDHAVTRQSSKVAVGIAIGVVMLAVMRFCFASRAELLPEEAYYWTYLQHPALSYFDHPPMVAWVIGLGTSWLGDTELGVRFGTILLSLVNTVLVFLLARLWFGAPAAWWAALIFNVTPIYAGLGFFAFPDGPLILFWLLTLWAMSQALLKNQSSYWWLAGLAYGAAMLSKYTAVLLGPSLLLFLWLTPSYRHWLKRPHPWLAVLLALAVFSPVIIWNAQHDWASFAFQTSRTESHKPHSFVPALLFWPMQIGVYSPLIFALFAVAAIRAIQRRHTEAWAFATAFFWPLFLIFVLASFKTEIHVNWTVPAFLTLLPAAGAVFHERVQTSRRWRIAGWIALVLNLVFLVVAFNTIVTGRPRILTSSHAGGWRELATQVEAAELQLERETSLDPFIIGVDKYNLAAELSFYTSKPAKQVNTFALGKHGLGFRFWTNLDSFAGHPAVAVLTKTNEPTLLSLRNYFDRVDLPRPIHVPTIGAKPRTIYLVNCHGYRPPVAAPR